jgi:predicted metalloprotease with PDZ domain
MAISFDAPGGDKQGIFFPRDGPTAVEGMRTNAETLLDSPILYGRNLRRWHFNIDGTPHEIVYWPLPQATPFDTVAFVDAIQQVAREAAAVFGKLPSRLYQFLIEDGAWGALEHKNSVTVGMPSKDLAKDPRAYLSELAHEYFHAWNLMRLYPEGRGGPPSVDRPAHSKGLWFSEGVTIYYAEALTRRAGFPENGMARKDLLALEMQSYYELPGNTRISPEVASARAVDTTGINGDYDANYYTQGRLIGTALDLILRDSTHGQKGLDDFMRAMYTHYALKRGFTTDDVQSTAADVCGCNLRRFFDDHVRNARPIDFVAPLRTIGLTLKVDTIPAADSAGNPFPDTRIWAYPRTSDRRMRVWINDPGSVWARSGLHTGQDLIAFNGVQVDSFPDFRRAVRSIKIGSEVPVDILEDGKPRRVLVRVPGYSRTRVRITEDQSATAAQVERRRVWETGR